MRKPTTYFLITFSFLLFYHQSYTQGTGVNKEKYRISIKKATDQIKIDGKLDEKSWENADEAKNFLNKWPTDEGYPPLDTKVKVTYDDNNLYISATCIENSPEYVIQTLKRDNSPWDSDGFMVILDPVNQQSNGFVFVVNPLGVQTEGLVMPFSDNDGFSRDWDNKWFAETTNEENGTWHVEMAIPFKTLRFDARLSEWGINFLRCDVQNNAYSTWAHIPRQFNGTDLGYMGSMVWDNPPKEVKSNFSIIPYVNTGLSQDFEDGNGEVDPNFNAGLDAKVAVSSSLNLDLTVNPDFSQVEVDVQQTNVTRFNLFFPERRTFFLENSDIFASFGIPPVRPFFSRRIGLDDDGNAIPILFGARLSGNLNEDWRVGLMSMQTQKTDTQAGQNYTVASFQRRLFKRSSFSGIMINRQAYDGEFLNDDFGRNLGGEFFYSSEDGNFSTWAGYNASFKPEKYTKNGFYSTGFLYQNRNITFLSSLAGIGENFIADAGFTMRLDNYDAERDTSIRIGYNQLFNEFSYRIYSETEKVFNFINLSVETFSVWDDQWASNYNNIGVSGMVFFTNTSSVRIGANYTNEYLPFPTNFVGEDYKNIEADWYSYQGFSVRYGSNTRKLFSFEAFTNYGTYYNGTLTQFGGGIRYRKQPWGNFELNFERNILKFPEEYGTADLWLVGPRIGINFSKKLFWTTFLQYNTQQDNFNVNSRLQWRFKPMSDLFLVYTDNYFVESFAPKSRAIILKLNYWLTL